MLVIKITASFYLIIANKGKNKSCDIQDQSHDALGKINIDIVK